MSWIRQFLRENGLFLALIVALVAAFLLLRTRDSGLASTEAFDSLLQTGQPVLVEFYSNT